MKTLLTLPSLALAFCLPTSLYAGDDAAKAAAKDLVAKHGAAMVMVEATLELQPKILEAPEELKAQIPDLPKSEQEGKAQGLVIDPSGIIAVPLAAINPAAVLAQGITQETPLGPIKIGADSSFLTVNVIDAEGVEHEAKVALQDTKSGLALVQLKEKPEQPWAAVELVKGKGHPDAFAPLLQLERLGATLDRQISVRTSRFVQELRIPGLFYELTGSAGAPGFATFDHSAKFVGLGVLPLDLPTQEITAAGIVLLPAARIVPLADKVRAASAE